MNKLFVTVIAAGLVSGIPLVANARPVAGSPTMGEYDAPQATDYYAPMATGPAQPMMHQRGRAGEAVRIFRLDPNVARPEAEDRDAVAAAQSVALRDPKVISALEAQHLGIWNVIDIGREGSVRNVYVQG